MLSVISNIRFDSQQFLFEFVLLGRVLNEQLLRGVDGVGKLDLVALLDEDEQHFAELVDRLR